MSPSGSVSLSSTGRMVVLPARTPKVSGLAAGALLGLVRSGRTVCWTSSAESLSASSEVCCGGMTSSQLLTSCMFWLTSHTLPGIHVVQDHQVPVHPEHIHGDALAFGTSTVLSSASFGTVPDILVRPRPRRMHTPAQLHRRRRHPLPAKRHRLRRRTIQRLLQQRLRRRDGHRIRAPDPTAAASRPARPPAPAHARPAGTTSPGPHPTPPAGPPPPPAADPPHPSTRPRCSTSTIRRRTLGIHRRDRDLPGLRIRTVNPVISTHRRHRPRRPRQHRLGILRIKTTHRRRRQRPDRALRRVRHRNDLRPETHLRRTRQLLIPAQPHLRRRHLVQRRPRTASSTNTVPASCNTSNVVDAGVTAPSNTRDG